MLIYLIGSLRSPRVPDTARTLREAGYEVFDDWYAAGPEADDYWQRYEKERGHTFAQALDGYAAYHVYEYDRYHLDRSDIGVLVLPAGKSGHLELGYLMGTGKPGYILLQDEPERFDVMYRFAKGVYTTMEDLLAGLERERSKSAPRREITGAIMSKVPITVGRIPSRISVPEVRNATGTTPETEAAIDYIQKRMDLL